MNTLNELNILTGGYLSTLFLYMEEALKRILDTIDNQQSELGTASPIETISDLLNTFIVRESEECSPQYLHDRVYTLYKYYLKEEDQ